MISPIALVATSTTLAAGQKAAISDETTLQNPFRGEGMLIDEISFETYGVSQAIANLWVELRLGTERITSYPLPAWLLGRNYNPGLTDDPSIVGGGSNPQYLNFYTWKLRRPIYVPPGQYVQPFFWNRGTQSFAVNVSMRGRSIGKNPTLGKTYLPWVTSFVPDPIVGTTFSLQSTTNDLYNPFDRPIYVAEFVGRIKGGLITAASDITKEFLGLDTYTQVRMYDSRGTILVKDKTPFGLLFSVIWKFWDANSQVDPGNYYRVYLDGDYSNPDGLGPQTAQPMLSMVSYREVAQ